MAKFDFATAKTDIEQIVRIVETVPEPLREVCFEMLFEAVFANRKAAASNPAKETPRAAEEVKDEQEKPPNSRQKAAAKRISIHAQISSIKRRLEQAKRTCLGRVIDLK